MSEPGSVPVSAGSWRAMAVGLSPCRCNSRIMAILKSNHRGPLQPGGAVSATALWVRAGASAGTNPQRNEVGNFRRPMMGRIHPALTGARVLAVIGKLEAGGVPEHVRVDRHAQFRRVAGASD